MCPGNASSAAATISGSFADVETARIARLTSPSLPFMLAGSTSAPITVENSPISGSIGTHSVGVSPGPVVAAHITSLSLSKGSWSISS